MIGNIRIFVCKLLAGANVSTVLIMLAVGYSGIINPEQHPLASCIGFAFPAFLVINAIFLVFWLLFAKRYALISLIGFMSCYVPVRTYIPINIGGDPNADDIHVMSYNVQNYTGAPRYQDSFHDIFNYIRNQHPDILCVQEDIAINHNTFVHYDSIYQYRDTAKVGSAGVSALGIYTNYRILKRMRIPYTSLGNGSMAWWLYTGHDTIIVINNHLESNHFSLSDRELYTEMIEGDMGKDTVKASSQKLIYKLAEAAAMRAPQANAVDSFVSAHSNERIIVCGDFNDHPLSYTSRTMSKRLDNCFVKAGRGVGLSYNLKGFYVRIDNILCSSHFTPVKCKVDDSIDASDHYPVHCWLKMQGK